MHVVLLLFEKFLTSTPNIHNLQMAELLQTLLKWCGGKRDQEDGSSIAITKQTEVIATTSEPPVNTGTTSDTAHEMAFNQPTLYSVGRGIPQRSPLANMNFDAIRESRFTAHDTNLDSDPDAILPVDPRPKFPSVEQALEDRRKLFERLRHPERTAQTTMAQDQTTQDRAGQAQTTDSHASNQPTSQKFDSQPTVQLARIDEAANVQDKGEGN